MPDNVNIHIRWQGDMASIPYLMCINHKFLPSGRRVGRYPLSVKSD